MRGDGLAEEKCCTQFAYSIRRQFDGGRHLTTQLSEFDYDRRNFHYHWNLIAGQKVKGTTVFNLAGEKLGTVDDIMIDKVSGRAIYAVMSFGGFLGMGEKFHPLPWATLKYDHQKGGYVVNLDKKLLQDAPTYDARSEFKWTPDYGRTVDSYYKTQSYWQ